ncbi:MAG: branched-chain amino acid ABC transporter permease [Bosea sp.]|uniref:branched-chain amino acid ABC transporter permease n=1 Tax=unclassified Bosea (in: a-proteobacteria) TaxID=2653178 RepID=UPI0009649B55|nr:MULTISPECIES: branched-chain amino acid ABC transporter permease [unclassified Bosea (in: a-proteobacteria)]MBN9455064.1 branched-chain amino acid ABC transporter permease [Bosea sp. (in: a-proteobacteria)]OJV04728.1 MAG: branched-chain amino acid ABC transporter permease [Bosea sp. 67-29]
MTARSFESRVGHALYAGRRWHPAELAFWLLAFAAFVLLPSQLLLLNEIAILALFALSLDLILGYAGIVSLGHAAFLGMGAYAAGLFAKHVGGDPVAGLLAGMSAGAMLGLLTSPLVLRGSDLTRLMITLGVALIVYELANSLGWLTGGADGLQGVAMGPVLGLFDFDIFGRTAYLYSLSVLFVLFLVARRVVHSPFGLSLRAIRDNPLRAAASGVPNARRLAAAYTLAAAYAGAAGALLAQTTQFVSLDVLDFHRSADLMLVLIIGGAGYLYGGLVGAIVFKLLQDAIASFTPQYWMFWIGLFLVLFVLGGREIIHGVVKGVAGRLSAVRKGAVR